MAWSSHPSASEILRVPGYLFWNPSGLTNEAAWGTKLGFCEKGVEVDFVYHEKKLSGELAGEEFTHKIFLGVTCSIKAVLKNYNTTTLARIFPGITAGTSVNYPTLFWPGTSMSSSVSLAQGRLLFVPDDQTNNPIFILQRAVPSLKGSFVFSRVNDTNFVCVFDNFRKSDSVAGMYYMGLLSGGVLI